MASDIGDAFSDLFREYKLLNPSKKANIAQKDFNVIWANLKTKCKTTKVPLLKAADELLKEYRQKNSQRKVTSLLNFFPKQVPATSTSTLVPSTSSNASTVSDEGQYTGSVSPEPCSSGEKSIDVDLLSDVPGTSGSSDEESPVTKRKKHSARPVTISDDEMDDCDAPDSTSPQHETPAQDKLKTLITVLESQLNAAILERDTGLGKSGADKTVIKLRKELEDTKKKLTLRMKKSAREKKYRAKRRESLEEIAGRDPAAAKALKIRESQGRPSIETDQPGLLDAIIDIAIAGGAADGRRRSEMIRSCRTLSDLTEMLEKRGFSLSRTACALRLIPRNPRTAWGKRHVNTVPVKLLRPHTDLHKTSVDGKFCTATIRSIETVAGMLGSSQVIFISQDDKARVPLGITAANKQSAIIMHVEYRVMLPDHDWVVASKHKLIPSVYAGIVVKEGKLDGDPALVSYSGPTYIGIRSGKHDSSSASSHAFDLEKLMNLAEFDDITKVNGNVKGVLILSVDGGPDENPRYPKVIRHAVSHFKQYDFDALYIFTNAPGRSAFNRVERRMAPLNRQISGVLLDHETYGSHTDNAGKTIDKDKELKNFEAAGQTLAEIWDGMTIDSHPVRAEYIRPGSGTSTCPEMPDQQWYMGHVRESQYFLQIVKCDDRECCTSMKTDLKSILPDGFFPVPFPLRRSPAGRLEIPEPRDVRASDSIPPLAIRQSITLRPKGEGFPAQLPYDFFCPSVQSSLKERICADCGLYFAAKGHATDHCKAVHRVTEKHSRVRPKEILDRRAEELLCVVDYNGLSDDVEWVNEMEVEEEQLNSCFAVDDEHGGLPVVENFAHWMGALWADDESVL